MGIIERLAEQRIAEAVARGELDDLPGMGKPLCLDDDDDFVPAELRMAYKVLKNAGVVPPEVELRHEIHSINELLLCVDDEAEQQRLSSRLRWLMLRLAAMRPGSSPELDQHYIGQLNRRLSDTN